MDCVECKANNKDGNRFCGQCGAEIGRSLDETVRKKGFRDRQATELEITESVVGRLMKWASWLGSVAALIVVLFGLLLGRSYYDVRTAVESGKTTIGTAVGEARKDIDATRQATIGLKVEVKQLQSNIDGYRKVNSDIQALQKDLLKVKDQVIDLSKSDLKVRTLTTSGTEFSSLGFGNLGCSPSALKGGTKVAYCAQGSPVSLYQLTSASSEPRPVSSLSPIGFQDVSSAPKATCTTANRGTFYVEKGAGNVPDRPFLCAKKSNGTYDWIQLSMIP